MYYKIIAEEDIFKLNEGLLAVVEFKRLTDQQMKYVCLICDPSNDNPVRTLQGKNKKEKALLLAGYKLEPDGKRLNKNARDVADGNIASIEQAIAKFKELHYDKNMDTYQTVSTLIGKNVDYIKEVDSKSKDYGKELDRANKFAKELPELLEAKQKVQALLNVEVNFKPELGSTYTPNDLPEETETDEPLSTLDLFMLNKK